jgi:hypothetical protein
LTKIAIDFSFCAIVSRQAFYVATALALPLLEAQLVESVRMGADLA